MGLRESAERFETEIPGIHVKYGRSENALEVRYNVFVEEQQIDEELDRDGEDQNAVQFTYYVDSKPVGTVRLRQESDKTGKLERLSVISGYRGQGIAKKLMSEFEDFCREVRINKIIMSAQKDVEGFYKSLNYSSYGEEYEEVGIPHIKMKKNLD